MVLFVHIRRYALPLVPWIVGIIIWSAFTRSRLVDPLLLASPAATLGAFAHGIASLELVRALGLTLLRAFFGFGIASLIGIPLGLVLGGVQIIQRALGGF